MGRIAFRYPEEQEQKQKAAEEAKREEARRQAAEEERLAQLNTAKPVRNWKYRIKLHGKDARYLWPERIGDDGVHTHIALSEEAGHRGLPFRQLSDPRGLVPCIGHWEGNQ